MGYVHRHTLSFELEDEVSQGMTKELCGGLRPAWTAWTLSNTQEIT